MTELASDTVPYALSGHDSLAKHITNAELAHELGKFVAITTHMAHQTLSSLGYGVFFQKRVGMHGELFDMPKLQTMKSTKTPHTPENKKNLHPVAQYVRDFGYDEFVQTCLVSTNPFEPGPMSAISHRPQTDEELDTMDFVMGSAGESARFNNWYKNIYCSKRPGVIGVESFLDRIHLPDTYEYFSDRIAFGEWYHENGSPFVDRQILSSIMTFSGLSLVKYLAAVDSKNV